MRLQILGGKAGDRIAKVAVCLPEMLRRNRFDYESACKGAELSSAYFG